MVIHRCATGIAELDQTLCGGIRQGNVVLLAGGSGMGKTTLGLEFLAHGAEKGEPGLFMSFTARVRLREPDAREDAFMAAKLVDDGVVRCGDLRASLLKMGLVAANEY